MKFLLRLTLGLAALLAGISLGDVSADGASASLTGLTVGFDGCYKNGYLTPVQVRFTAGGLEGRAVRVVLESLDPDGSPTYREKSAEVQDGESRADLLFMSGRENAPLTVRLVAPDGSLLAERTFKPEGIPPALRQGEQAGGEEPFLFPKPIDSQQPLWLVVGGGTGATGQMLSSLQLPADRIPVPVPIKRLADLPCRPDGLDAADLVVLNASDRTAFDDSQKAAAALKLWLMLGGKTVLFGSAESLDLLASGGALSDFVPGTVDTQRPAELRAAPSLVRFVPKAKNLVMLGSLDSPYLKFPYLSSPVPEARAGLSEEGKPLLVRRPVGFGTSLFFAADPQSAPLDAWNGRNGLLMKVFASEVERLTAQSGQTSLIRLGYRDLQGQLRSALDKFSGIRSLPFSAVFALMALFVAVIGPLDWFITHRVLKHPNFTWITLPVWLVLFTALAVGLGSRFHLRQYRINTAEMTDIDTETGLVRGFLWSGIYAPEDARLDITAVPALPALSNTESELTWLGLSGTGLGGISSPVRSLPSASEGYTLEGAAVHRFPVPIRSTRSLYARWRAEREPAASRLAERDGVLTGSLFNPFNGTMNDAVLLYGGHAWFLGTLSPGETPFDPARPKTDELQRMLTGSNNPFDLLRNDSARSPVWERFSDTSADIPSILRVSGFYRLAGGRAALGLGNEGMLRLDASDSLGAGRAILLASMSGEQTRLEMNLGRGGMPEPNRCGAFVRLWIPVDIDDGRTAEPAPDPDPED